MAVLPFIAFGQQSFKIEGKTGAVSAPAKVFMLYTQQGQRVVDSAAIQNGSFSFQGEVAEPLPALLVLDHEGKGLAAIQQPDMMPVFLENGTISVSISDLISKADLSGTPLNADQHKLTQLLEAPELKRQALMEEYQAATSEQRTEEAFMEQISERYDAIESELNAVRAAFIKENPNSLVSLMQLAELAGPVMDEQVVAPLFSGLSQELKETPMGKAISEHLESALKVGIGAVAPEFSQNDPDGNSIALASFRGKYVLLDFWASWCGPCRQENPNIVAAYEAYKDKGFTVLGISLDQENAREKWLKAIEDDKLTWTQVSDLKYWKNEVAQLYGVRAIPQSYLLDPEGKIIAKNLRGKALHEKLAELLD